MPLADVVACTSNAGFGGCTIRKIKSKSKKSGEGKAVRFKTKSSAAEMQGKRASMEDASVRIDRMQINAEERSRKSFYAVYDGPPSTRLGERGA